MFAKAYALVRDFTQPVIISARFYDNNTSCQGGNFLILNDEGTRCIKLDKTGFAYSHCLRESGD